MKILSVRSVSLISPVGQVVKSRSWLEPREPPGEPPASSKKVLPGGSQDAVRGFQYAVIYYQACRQRLPARLTNIPRDAFRGFQDAYKCCTTCFQRLPWGIQMFLGMPSEVSRKPTNASRNAVRYFHVACKYCQRCSQRLPASVQMLP